MTDTSTGGGAGGAQPRTITLEGLGPVTVERINGVKMNRAFAITRAIGKKVPDLNAKVAAFRTRFSDENALALERPAAMMRFPDRLAHLTEADWESRGHIFRIPVEPGLADVIAHIYADVVAGEDEDEDGAAPSILSDVYRLIALLTIPNGEVNRLWASGDLKRRIGERADELLEHAYADEIVELAVMCGEVLGEQYRTKRDALGDRLGNAARLVGLDPATLRQPQTTSKDSDPMTSPESLTPTSSTDSPASITGTPEPSSPAPPTSSPASGNGHEPTTSVPPPTPDPYPPTATELSTP